VSGEFSLKPTVIVSTYTKNNYELVMDCIESIKQQTLRPYEILLVLDDDQNLINFYSDRISNVKIVNSGGFGLSRARNAGVKNANGNILVFIDDDAVAEKNWLEHHVKNYARSCVVGVGGIAKAYWEEKRPSWFPEELDWIVGSTYRGHVKEKSYIRNPIGCNMSFRKSVFNKVGYFNDYLGRFGKNLLSAEETEFSLRIFNKLPNAKIIFDPNIIVYHKVPKKRTTIIYLIKRSYSEGKSKKLINNSGNLKSESRYLKFLLIRSIPEKLIKIYRLSELLKLVVILLTVFFVSIGYFFIPVNRELKLV